MVRHHRGRSPRYLRVVTDVTDAVELMLDGLLDEQTREHVEALDPGAYQGSDEDYWRRKWFVKRPRKPLKRTDRCPHCGDMFAAGGPPLKQHIEAKHRDTEFDPTCGHPCADCSGVG